MLLYLLPIAAYLLGSISSAIVLSKIMGIADPRQVGSGNPGATNILRYGGKLLAAATLTGDILKGVIPVLIARAMTDDDTIISATVVAAFLGHVYPIFFSFKGGKGIATACGVLTALSLKVGATLLAIWVIAALAFRYSSLAGLIAAGFAPLLIWLWRPGIIYVYMTIFIMLILFWRHRSNIKRLMSGQETKIF